VMNDIELGNKVLIGKQVLMFMIKKAAVYIR